jgi:hypothetical protein
MRSFPGQVEALAIVLESQRAVVDHQNGVNVAGTKAVGSTAHGAKPGSVDANVSKVRYLPAVPDLGRNAAVGRLGDCCGVADYPRCYRF